MLGKDDIGAADRLIKHLWDEVDVVHQRIDDRDIVTQGVFQANPGGGVGVHFLGQGIDLQVSQAFLARQTLQNHDAVIIGRVINNDQLIVADCFRNDFGGFGEYFFNFIALITNDKNDR